MRQVVKNYIRKENIDSPNSSTINFAIVDFIPFLNYITKVLSIFDKKQYQYHILKVINDKSLMQKEMTVCLIYNTAVIDQRHFNVINTESLLNYVAGNVKDNKDFIYFEIKEKEIPLLDKSMNINLTSFLIDKFPYLNDIVYDIINHKYEKVMNNSDINYQELVSDLEKKYHIQIAERQKFLIEEKAKLTKEEQKKERELNQIIAFIEKTELDEGTKKMLIYSVDKYRKPND